MSRECRHHDHEGRYRGPRHHRSGRRPRHCRCALRIAVVQEGVDPKAVASKFGHETVTVNASIDRVTFTHVESDIAFPLPQPLGLIDAYVVYVGFDPVSAKGETKKPPDKPKPVTKKPAAKPRKS